MILSLVTDAAYLVLPDLRCYYATLYTLANPTTSRQPCFKPKWPVQILVKTICDVPASASEAETGDIFIGLQEAVPAINTLIEIGRPQPKLKTWSVCVLYLWITDRIA